MRMHTILAAYDGSEWSLAAFDFALDLARSTGAGLRLLAVVRPPDFAEDVETEALIERGRETLQASMQPPAARAAAGGVAWSLKSSWDILPSRSSCTRKRTTSITSWSVIAATRFSIDG